MCLSPNKGASLTIQTHVAFSLTIATFPIMAAKVGFGELLVPASCLGIFYSSLAIGAVFPDIDEPESWIGKRTIIISNVIKKLFGHRGMTHTLLSFFLIIIASTLYSKTFLAEEYFFAAVGFSFGWLLHALGDGWTVGGVPYFLPFSKKKHHIVPKILQFKTNSMTEVVWRNIFFLSAAAFGLTTVLYSGENQFDVWYNFTTNIIHNIIEKINI